METPEVVATTLRPYWTQATGDRATVVQAVEGHLEIVPAGTSKGSGVNMLLDHLGITPNQVQSYLLVLAFIVLIGVSRIPILIPLVHITGSWSH